MKKHLMDDVVETVYPGEVDVALDALTNQLEELSTDSLNSTHWIDQAAY